MRNSYESYISNWIFNNLPSSKEGLVVQDLDFILSNYKTKKFMFLEVKTRGNQLSYAQRKFYTMIHKSLIKTDLYDGREYIGTHLLKFDGDGFEDGNVYLDGAQIGEHDLKEFFIYELGL